MSRNRKLYDAALENLNRNLVLLFEQQDFDDALDDGRGLLAVLPSIKTKPRSPPLPAPYRNIVQLDVGIWGWVKRLFKKEK